MADVHSYEIYLNIYDFAKGNRMLQWLGLPLYHTGVEINQVQFCYAIITTEEDCTGVIMIQPETAEYQFHLKRYVGEVTMPAQHFQRIIDSLSKKYTCGNYHAFTNNCNHFSEELIGKLLGTTLPKPIFRATNLMKLVCCCIPEALLTGKWAAQALEQLTQPHEKEDVSTTREKWSRA